MKKIQYPLVMAFFIFSCEAGFYDEEPVNIFTGCYDVDEWSESLQAQSYFEMRIFTRNRDHGIIRMENFYNAGITVYAEVNGFKIRIPVQQTEYYEIEGYGSLYDGQLTINYSVADKLSPTGFRDVCNAICYKR